MRVQVEHKLLAAQVLVETDLISKAALLPRHNQRTAAVAAATMAVVMVKAVVVDPRMLHSCRAPLSIRKGVA